MSAPKDIVIKAWLAYVEWAYLGYYGRNEANLIWYNIVCIWDMFVRVGRVVVCAFDWALINACREAKMNNFFSCI
jgi:hypothetical protein